MAVNLSPVGGVAAQFFDNNGVILSGGKLFTYAAGTTTPQATYTASNGAVAWTNPIVLNSAGRVPSGGEIWLTDGLQYKFVLKDSNDVTIATYDNITGINSNFVNYTNQQELQTATSGQTVFTLTTMSYQPGTNSLSVFVDGVNQYGPGAQYAYTETSDTVVTFVSGLHVGAEVKFTTSQINASSYGTAAQIAFTGFKGQSGNVQDLADDDGSDWIGFEADGTGAVAISAEDKMRQMVSVKDFGAVGDGVTNDTAAIQSALNTGKAVYLPTGTYAINAKLKLAADGQIVYGDGNGNINEPARTIIKWIGALGGTMLSISNGTTENWQNCTVRDMWLNGNSLALTAVQGYDGSIAGGAWRNRYVNLTISGLTGVNNTAFDLGGGAFPDFAHDSEITGCFVIGAARGVICAGAITRLINTTFSLCTDAIIGLGGSAWTCTGCVFSQSGNLDFDGANIQLAQFNGCWFEDSVNGIYKAATSQGSVSFVGCYLQTKSTNTTKLMDMGNAAGNFVIKGCYVPVSSGSSLIINVNSSYDYDVLASNVTIQPGYRARANGFVRSDNGAFAAGLTSDISNATGDGTTVNLNANAFTEEYDTENAFAAATGVFTAPLDGFYQFSASVALGNLGAGHTSAYFRLVTSYDTYLFGAINPGAVRTGGAFPDYAFLQGTITVGMVPTDTAYLQVVVDGSTKTVSVLSGGTGTDWRTRFEGRMI
jgi:hypothetical protein